MKRQVGFSLIELLVVMSIATVAMLVMAPSLLQTYGQNRLTQRSSELISSIQYARAEAIKRGTNARVTITPNALIGTSPNWAAGWTIFLDTTTNANGGVSPTTGSSILQVYDPLPSQIVVGTTKDPLSYISFVGSGDAKVTSTDASANGFVKSTGGYQTGAVLFQFNGKPVKKRCIKIYPPGLADVIWDADVATLCPAS
jgi:type IV fimbrial biogenesis protein FimT